MAGAGTPPAQADNAGVSAPDETFWLDEDDMIVSLFLDVRKQWTQEPRFVLSLQPKQPCLPVRSLSALSIFSLFPCLSLSLSIATTSAHNSVTSISVSTAVPVASEPAQTWPLAPRTALL